ncbi:Putative signal transduction protein with CBS domains [Methanocaldococcus lauensis]|uniref:Signal transduction protein with CBS domains n=1 Tax=Methanocaldococcus lauensis TaxID=2546128 RepID=A0A8D6SV33_9EURY|nr:CBS domain-containing protein [Methanocaldococcus lauensis]CAB3289252.1 Putative signal transduction protein with CBS domains [Methanocaldococcus lauensis]
MFTEPVKEIMTRDVVTVTPETPISKAIGIMEENGFHHLIVVDKKDDKEEYYLISIRDLLLASSVQEEVRTLMYKPHYIHEDTPVLDAVCEMLESGQRAAPIVNDEGKLVGIITDYDIMARAARSKIMKDTKITKIMTRNVITINENDSIGKARALMRDNNIGRLVVVDDEGNPVGMVTEVDIIKKIYKPKRRMTYGEVKGEKVPRMGQPVKLIMNTPLITVDVDASAADAARVMQEYDIRGVPVVKGKSLKGIVTRLDIIKYIADLKKGAMIEVEIHGMLDPEVKDLAERIIATEVKKMVKQAGKIHWIKINIKKDRDKGGVPYYRITTYVKTPNKLYVGEGRPKASLPNKLEAEGEDIAYISEHERWEFIDILKESLDSVLRQLEADFDKYHPKHIGREIKEQLYEEYVPEEYTKENENIEQNEEK